MPPTYSRPARDDEIYVLGAFIKHVHRCKECDYYVFAQARPVAEWNLCEGGHSVARDVTRYVYHRQGVPYSTVDLHSGSEPLRVEIPERFVIARHLLQAVEFGLRLRRSEGGDLGGVLPQARLGCLSRMSPGGSNFARLNHRPRFQEEKSRTAGLVDRAPAVLIRYPEAVHIHLGRGARLIVHRD